MFKYRLKEVRKMRKLTQEELAEKVKTTKSTISNYENGYSAPSIDMLSDLATALNTTTDCLLGRTDTIYDIATSSNSERFNGKDAIFHPETTKDIPVIGTIKTDDTGSVIKEYLGEEAINAKTIRDESFYYLTVKGDSMISDGIYEGDLALIREQSDVENGNIAAVLVNNDEAILKHVYKIEGGIILQASNPSYPPRVFIGEECNNVKIIGQLKEIKRKF